MFELYRRLAGWWFRRRGVRPVDVSNVVVRTYRKRTPEGRTRHAIDMNLAFHWWSSEDDLKAAVRRVKRKVYAIYRERGVRLVVVAPA